MANKYIYASSLGCDDHADFEVHFPSQLMIKPYSQIRCISCRINPSDNLVEIDDTNDAFYVGVDHWNKRNSSIPLLPIKLDHGLYNLIDGSSSKLSLNAAIEEKVAEQLKPYCMLRGGSECTMTNSKLKLKLSTMQMYGAPTAALTDEVAEYWYNWHHAPLPFQGTYASPIVSCEKTQLTRLNTHYGIKVQKDIPHPQYYTSPPCVTGMTGGGENNKYISHSFELDFTGLSDNVDLELGAPKTHTTDFIRIYFGDASAENFGGTWANLTRYKPDNVQELDNTFLYCLEFNNEYLVIRYWDTDDEVQEVVKTMRAGTNYNGVRYNIARKFTVTCKEWEDAYDSYISLEVQIDYADDGNYATLAPINFSTKKDKYRQSASSNPNCLAMVFKTDIEMEDMVTFTAAVDDHLENMGWNLTTSAYGARASENADIPFRMLSILSENVNKGADAMDIMYLEQATETWTDNEDLFIPSLTLDPYPNADILSWDSATDQGLVLTTSSNTGITAEGAVSGNNREFPIFYLSLPTLPLENVTANYLQGHENKFITPIELSQSQTNQRLYTAKLYTEQYNTLTNSAPLNLSTLRIRICDINGVPVKQLDKYTIVTLEIRENPHKVEQEMIKFLRSSTQNTDRNIKVIHDQ